MKRALALLAAAGAMGAASCDFDGAYHQYCEGNPACGGDAGMPDGSAPDASLKPCTQGDPHDCPGAFCQNGFCVPLQCDPADETFSTHLGPSSCWYGQICTDERACEEVDTGCGRRASDLSGPFAYRATASVEEGGQHCAGQLLVVTAEFYAPHSVDGMLRVRLRSPPGLALPPCGVDTDQFDGASWGGFIAQLCCEGFDGDPSGWAVSLSDQHQDFKESAGPEFCFP